jgi:hypothetical protein
MARNYKTGGQQLISDLYRTKFVLYKLAKLFTISLSEMLFGKPKLYLDLSRWVMVEWSWTNKIGGLLKSYRSNYTL